MSFLRHIGKIGDRKVAIVFREVPNEPHMALVTYTESLNRHLHDPMMQCIESDIGQNSKNLADALNRTHTKDGKYILQVLHAEGLLKKVQTENVIVTPNGTTKIRLDELNKILTEMENGEDAVKRLAEINNSTTSESTAVAKKMRGDTPRVTDAPQGVLGDSAIANNLVMIAYHPKEMEMIKSSAKNLGHPIENVSNSHSHEPDTVNKVSAVRVRKAK